MRNLSLLAITIIIVRYIVYYKAQDRIQSFSIITEIPANNVNLLMNLTCQLSDKYININKEVERIILREIEEAKTNISTILALGSEFTTSLEYSVYNDLKIKCRIYIYSIEVL